MQFSLPIRFGLLAGLLIFAAQLLPAQSAHETALRFLRADPAKFGLSAADVADVRVTDEYKTKHNGVTHVWVQQQYAGIPVFNALFGLHQLPGGEIVHLSHRFEADLQARINTTAPSLSAYKALEMAMANLGFSGFALPGLRQKINDRNWVFEGGAISRSPIPMSACYAPTKDGRVRLAWTMIIAQANTPDIWNMRVDAQTGLIIDKFNQTAYCQVDHDAYATEDCPDEQPAPAASAVAVGPLAAEQYRVFALPVESPAHGARQLLLNPASPTASPFGWLDVNGQAGAEYTYTRGNNVYAYDDADNNDTPPATPGADAGASLNFDFAFDANGEPTANLNAAVTNLFYMNNMMHDITHGFGFDEAAGNFQTRNHTGQGLGNDAVQAEAVDGGGENNANFGTPPDGNAPTMQMYRWGRTGGKILNVTAPEPAIGSYFASATNGWGTAVSAVPLTGEVVVANNGTGAIDSVLGCDPAANSLLDKIAMVNRGGCEFGLKALTAQQSGAIACIICNYGQGTVTLGPGASGGQVTIPVVMLQKSDCDYLKQFVGNGLTVSLVQPAAAGPNFLDGDFDNGIIAHEYGHGISNRLTGGPGNSGCLGNDEQMGEGWSDFFALATTVQPGDAGTKNRGVGTYVVRQGNQDIGIRRYPYSTDMTVSPVTFATVAENTAVHALGEVWNAMLWDLYWAMVEKYGYEQDLSNPNSGNHRAIQLVMDGMKLQPCNPGFVDGRDAILLADKVNYAGKDTCLIIDVFARRGMGVGSDQGSNLNAGDGVENFDPIPTCLKELKIKKVCTPTIAPGGTATFTITITNHKDDATPNTVVTDELPAGLTFGSASNGGVYDNGMVIWDLDTVAAGQVTTLSYTARYLPGTGSPLLFQDPMDTDNEWAGLALLGMNETFALQSEVVKVGSAAWKASESSSERTELTLAYIGNSPITISGTQPVFRFWHQFNTEKGADAGLVEVQKDSSNLWLPVAADKMIRGGYNARIPYSTFTTPYLSGFSGDSDGWLQSYVDMSAYAGEAVRVRFRFGTNNANGEPDGGWIVDGLQLLDLINFNGLATVTSAAGDTATASAPEKGVIVDAGSTTATEEPTNTLGLQVQPNPADDLLHLQLSTALDGPVQVSLLSTDGRLALRRQLNGFAAGQVLTLEVQQVPTGLYLVRVDSAAGSSVTKVVIR